METMKAFSLKILRWIANHPYVKALQKSMVSVIGVSFIAGLLLILQNPPVSTLTQGAFIDAWTRFALDNAGLISLGIQMTLGFIGVYTLVAFIIALSHHYELHPFHPVLAGLTAYLLLSVTYTYASSPEYNLTYLGYSGIFGAFILGILVVEFSRFTHYLRSKFKPKTEVQERLAQPVEATLGTFVIILVAFVVRYFLDRNGIFLPGVLDQGLSVVLTSSNTLWYVLAVIVLSKLLWFVGLNGNSLILLSLMPMMVVFNAENLFAYQNDMALPYLFSTGFLFFELGVLPMATAILLFSKNKENRSAAKLGLLPAVFNFQETLIAGLPLVFNGLYLIPFILSSVVSLTIAYLAMTFFWISKPLFAFSLTMPGFLGVLASTVDWKAVVLWFGVYILCTLIYWPFIRYQNKKETRKVLAEQAAKTDVVQ